MSGSKREELNVSKSSCAKAGLSRCRAIRRFGSNASRTPPSSEPRGLGYDVTEIGEGQRILATPIEERLTLTSCGVLELLTEGSTKPVAQVRTHAGIARVMRYTFTLT
jgi:hypothetical protein